jgi:hypothetical protein
MASRAFDPIGMKAVAVARGARRERVEAGIPVDAAKAMPGRGNLQAALLGGGVASGKQRLREGLDGRSYPGERPFSGLDRFS